MLPFAYALIDDAALIGVYPDYRNQFIARQIELNPMRRFSEASVATSVDQSKNRSQVFCRFGGAPSAN
jgi:hypothetical protein